MDVRQITAQLLPAFRPYLLAEAADALEQEREDVLAFGAVAEGGKTCGAIAAIIEEGILTVFSLYVDKAVRRQGIATALLQAATQSHPEWEVEAAWICPAEETAVLTAFLERSGFEVLREETLHSFPSQSLRAVPVIRRAFAGDFCLAKGVVPLSLLTAEEWNQLCAEETIDPRLRLDAVKDRMTEELSFAWRQDGEVTAYLACGAAGPGNLAVLSILARKEAPSTAIFHLVAAAAAAAYRYFGGEYCCWMDAVTADGAALTQALGGTAGQTWHQGYATMETI